MGTRRAGVVLAALGLLALSACSAGRSPPARGHSAPTSAATAPSPSRPAPSPHPSAPSNALPPTTTSPAAIPNTPTAWPSDLVVGTGTGTVTDLNPTTDAVYALDRAPIGAGPHTSARPLRYDLITHRVLFGAPISDADAMTVTGGWVWVVGSAPNGASGVVVYTLDPDALTTVATKTLLVSEPGDFEVVTGTLTATAGGPLWVAGGGNLYALSATTGAILHELPAGMTASSLSTSPDGSVLYVGGRRDLAPLVLSELDAHSGRLLASESETDGVGDTRVAGTNGGVWVSFRTGMMGVAVLHDKTGLRAVPTPQYPFPSPFEQGMGVTTNVSDGTLWLAGLQRLACADPLTGALRVSEPPVESQIDTVVASGGTLYGGGTGGLSVISAPRACFG